MVKRILRGLLIVLLILVIALAAAVVVIDLHLRSNEEKLLHEYAETKGLEVAFRRTNLRVWAHFPRVSLTVDSLVVRDTLQARDAPALLAVERFETLLDLGALLRDTVRLEKISLRRGSLHLAADSSGTFNAGHLLEPGDTSGQPTGEHSFSTPLLAYDGGAIEVDDVHLTYLNPTRRKDIRVALDTVRATLYTEAEGGLRVVTQLSARVGGLAFNTEKGAYLSDTPLSGWIDGRFRPGQWSFSPTRLRIGGEQFDLSAEIARAPGALSHIYVGTEGVDYERARALMPEALQTKLGEFHADGRIPVRAHIISTLERGENPEVRVELKLSGQRVRIKQYTFGGVHAGVRLVNRLDEANHGIPDSRKNMRVDLEGLDGYWGNIRMRAERATVAAFAKDARLMGALRFTGPTRAVSEWLENENFFFSGGGFGLNVDFDASLLDYEEMIATTSGVLVLDDLDVVYRPAAVRFPFRRIELRKAVDDVGFHLQSRPLATGFTFALDGRLDNLTPLLIDVPGGRLRTDVTLSAPRIDWTDFLSFFGEDGILSGETDTTATAAAPDNQAVKQSLLGLQETFRPDVNARFDTVAYYDVFTLTDFATGLHFTGDTLVLERTAFHWEGSDVAFDARLGLATRGETPFRLDVATDHLNLNRLRPTLDYFGLQLPAGLETLPDNLHIRFAHEGIIEDTLGIRPGYNVGNLDFDDGASGLFSGNMNYAPGVRGLTTNFHLDGDPQFVNELFAAENFFFGSGRFGIDLHVEGMPSDLPELVNMSQMQLRIDSSRIEYRPGGVYVPVETFAVSVDRGAATYRLDLLNDSTRRSVAVSGSLDRLAAFLYPDPGETYAIETDIRASRLHLSDITGFIRSAAADTGQQAVDTVAFETRDALSASSGILGSFRPRVSLLIDTFQASAETALTQVHAGLYVRDSTELILERSGFRLGDGSVEIAANYRLDDRANSPFHADVNVINMDLGRLREELQGNGLTLPTEVGEMGGALTLSGRLDGRFDEAGTRVDPAGITGALSYRLTDLELADWPALAALGRKLRMKRRFEQLHFAPLSGELKIDSGRVLLPRTEIQSTALQLFVEGHYDLATGPDLLVSVPLRNVGRGLLARAPAPTGYAEAGWKVYLVTRQDEAGELTNKFRLGKRRYFKERGRLEEWRALRRARREARRARR